MKMPADPRKPTTGGPAAPSGLEAFLMDEALNSGRTVSAGVGIKEGELSGIKAIAESLGGKEAGITPNALMRLAIRLFLQGVRSGEITPSNFVQEPRTPKKKVLIPGEDQPED